MNAWWVRIWGILELWPQTICTIAGVFLCNIDNTQIMSCKSSELQLFNELSVQDLLMQLGRKDSKPLFGYIYILLAAVFFWNCWHSTSFGSRSCPT
jgi:hypothetical protein